MAILAPIGAALGLAGLAVATLYARARGDYPVLPTVADDPSLPALEIEGYRFHAETHGDPTNPTVIVLHGGPGADYRSLLALSELADTHHVVFYDQRGAGLSERVPAESITASVMLDDLGRIADRFSPTDPVSLIGHSWGATLAAGYMRQHPDRVAAAVLAEPGYLDPAEYDLWQQRYDALMKGWDTTKLMIQAGFEAQLVDGPDDHAASATTPLGASHHFQNAFSRAHCHLKRASPPPNPASELFMTACSAGDDVQSQFNVGSVWAARNNSSVYSYPPETVPGRGKAHFDSYAPETVPGRGGTL